MDTFCNGEGCPEISAACAQNLDGLIGIDTDIKEEGKIDIKSLITEEYISEHENKDVLDDELLVIKFTRTLQSRLIKQKSLQVKINKHESLRAISHILLQKKKLRIYGREAFLILLLDCLIVF